MLFWFLIITALFGLAVMYLWNWLIPDLFGGQLISFWQAIGLLALAKLLIGFGSFSTHHWRSKFFNKWSTLSDEERQELREKFKARWCHREEI
jgi:O-antigen/teichoic acid export membrane protein